ncbi:protein of unknown function [Methylococcus capsulatus]|uniref:Uncharacterized protein n=1 Tax=Methylococcus capsulatus TaxID=414 RepID=A0AA35XTY7_METCP|nr:protein of unknown function [Methylococcus capsulatus]
MLPKGFMRIRHFGWLANRCRAGRRSTPHHEKRLPRIGKRLRPSTTVIPPANEGVQK